MEIVLLVVGVIVLCVFLVAQDSQKKTQKEKYLDAIGQVAHSAADTITGVAYRITESSSEKVHREALEVLAQRNGSLYRGGGSYSQKGYIKRLFEVDEFFKKKSLDVLGLSVERWQRIGRHLFYVGAIKYFSRDHSDFTKKNDEDRRAWIINEWVKETGFGLKDSADTLREALAYFNIPEEEWIKYGDTVLAMYNVNDDPDIKRFGVISEIKAKDNNLHRF